jgi:hypothetical protein
MVKYEIKIRITPEEFMKMTMRYLPFEIISAGEIEETPTPPPEPAIRFDKRFDLPKPKVDRPHKRYARRPPTRPMRLDLGMNRIIVEALKERSHRLVELKRLIVQGGFSESSLGSRLDKLREKGIVEPAGNGLWCIKKEVKHDDP